MFDTMTSHSRWTSAKFAAVAWGGVLLVGGLALAPSTASANTTSNAFTFKGAYQGTLKFTPSSFTCTYGKTYNGKGYLVTISHMKGTISGAGSGPWAMTAYVPKQGTTQVAHADVNSLTDTSFQGSGVPINAFDETSGAITYNGSKGSINLSVEYKTGATHGRTSTVTGSWNCP